MRNIYKKLLQVKRYLSVSKYLTIAFMFIISGTLKAQTSILSWNFESNNIGDSLSHIGWGPYDIQSAVVDDPLASGNKVMKNVVHNYNAAPVLMFVLPSGKTLADYDSLNFKGYFQKGDVAYKYIIAQAYQAKPTGHHFLDTDTLGSYNRAQGASTAWENISLDISNSLTFSDTVYIALGINCAGTSGSDTTTWFADDMTLVEKTEKPSSVLSYDFENYNIGDSLSHIGWNPYDIQSAVVDDPLASGNKVMKNVVHNYNAAPVLTFVLPDGKTLADYDSLTFKGYFQKGDVAYKYIVAQAYQTKPTGHFLDTDTLGAYNRAKGASTSWENISLNISNSSTFSDTVYIALGINCAGTSGSDTTTWFADDIKLVAKSTTPPSDTANVVTNGDFEETNPGVVDTTDVKGWLIQVAPAVTQAPVFEIVGDTVQHGSHALKVTVNGLGANQWDIQIVADSLHVTPGVVYDYSIWVKAEKAGAQINLTVGNYSYSEYKALRPVNLTTQWKQYTTSFTVNDNQTIIRAPIHFGYAGNVNNPIYLDNLRIIKHVEMVDSSLIWKGPALAAGEPKFLGSAYLPNQEPNFNKYWTQLTPENAGKWGSVAGSSDTAAWNWSGLNNSYNYAMDNDLVFKDHCLIWGQQQPSWISSLDSATQYKYIETWIRMVGQKYPKTDLIDVVNEPLNGHNPPDGQNGRANYKNALGGNGKTGWDWVVNAFKLARKYLPNTKLLINDYGILNSSSNTDAYIGIINILKDSSLIDGIGCQAHGLENTSASTVKSNLDKLAATGLPIYISEFDLNIADDNTQKTKYQELFPVFWQHPDVKGVTLWGYIEGLTWRTSTFLVHTNGTARPALFWLAQYIKNPTGINETALAKPSNYELDQNYPNPFNPTTNIRYTIVKTSKVSLKVFDILGREVQTLVNTVQAPGRYTVTFNAQNLASGVYFYQINSGDFTATKKLMLLK